MSYFVKRGNTFNVTDKESMDLYDSLPVGHYIVQYHQLSNTYFLEMVDGFKSPKKLYGDITQSSERIFNTFLDRDKSTGVLLVGEKGSGKTLLAKELSIICGKNEIPTIIINSSFFGDTFNKFIQDIDQPVLILFDEFEKVYNKDEQNHILTLLDGVYPSKKLFILTSNDSYRINDHMQNRPGRLFYMLEFDCLTPAFIKEYCEENLKNSEHLIPLQKVASVFGSFNFDMLQALVEEVNRYDETPQKALDVLNIKPSSSNNDIYEVSLVVDGESIDTDQLEDSTINGHPLLIDDYDIMYFVEEEGKKNNWYGEKFDQGELKNINHETGTFVFINEDGNILTLKRKEYIRANFLNF